MTIRHLGVLSVGKMLGVLYAIMGLLVGGLFALVSMVGLAGAGQDAGPFAFMFGIGSIVIFPLVYGFMGFVGGIITAALYNILASVVGGIEVEMS